MKKINFLVLCVMCVVTLFSVYESKAVSSESIDIGVQKSLAMLMDIPGGKEVLKNSVGALVFPAVFKAGIGIGGEYGEGALVVNGETTGYYSTATVSLGFQLGGQKKTIIMLFMDKSALNNFENSDGWKVGADASVTLVAVGADGSIDTSKTNQPIVAFVFDQKGLMYNLTLEGAKVTKIKR